MVYYNVVVCSSVSIATIRGTRENARDFFRGYDATRLDGTSDVRTEHHWHLVRRHGPVRTNTAKRYRSIFSRKRNGGSRSKLERKLGAGLHHVRNKVHVNLRRGLNRSTVHASRHILHQDLMSGINRDEGGWTVLEVPNSSLDLLASKRTEADLTQFAEITDGAESPL